MLARLAAGSLTLAELQTAIYFTFRNACVDGQLGMAQWLWGLRDPVTSAGLTLADVQCLDNWAFRLAHERGHLDIAHWLLEIGRLPAELLSVVPKKDSICPICIDTLVDPAVAKDHDARHAACRTCLAAWLAKSRTCPMCREAL